MWGVESLQNPSPNLVDRWNTFLEVAFGMAFGPAFRDLKSGFRFLHGLIKGPDCLNGERCLYHFKTELHSDPAAWLAWGCLKAKMTLLTIWEKLVGSSC